MSAETETSEIIRRRLFEWERAAEGGASTTVEEYDGLAAGEQAAAAELVPGRERARSAQGDLSVPPVGAVGLRAQVAGAAALPADARRPAAAGAVGVEGLSGGLQGRPQGSADRAGHGTARRPAVPRGPLRAAGRVAARGGGHHRHRRQGARARAPARRGGDCPTIKKARLHRKVATTILFESNGGQQRGEATLPEIRLAVAEPASTSATSSSASRP